MNLRTCRAPSRSSTRSACPVRHGPHAVLAAALAICLALPACGGEPPDPAVAGDVAPPPAIGTPTRQRSGRAARADTPDDPAAEARFLDLVAAWENAADDPANERALAAILATGKDGAARLVRWLAEGDENQRDSANKLLVLMGADAVPALVELAARPGDTQGDAAHLLDKLLPLWRGSAIGPDVCRALVACLDGPESYDARNALELARPAVAAVVPELVERWRASWTDDDASDGGALEILVAAGPDARAAAAAALEALESDDTERRVNGGLLLASIGATTPADLARLVALLAAAPLEDSAWDRREGVLQALASWGDAAGSAAPKIEAFLDRAFPKNIRIAAAEALAAMPGAAQSFVTTAALLAWNDDEDDRVRSILRDSVLARSSPEALGAAIRELPMDRVQNAMNWAEFRAESATGDRRAELIRVGEIARARMAASPDAEERLRAPWFRVETPSRAPDWLVALLDDPDMRVRSGTTYSLARIVGTDTARILDVAGPIATDRIWSGDAICAIGVLAERDPRALAALLALVADPALEDPPRDLAVRVLGDGTSPIPGNHPAARAVVARAVLAGPYTGDATRALLRFDGGLAAFVDTIRGELGPPPGRVATEAPYIIVAAVAAAGPKAEPLRGSLTAWGGEPGRRALDALRGGGAEILRNGGDDEATFRRLLAAGPEARGWIAAFADGLSWPPPDWLGPAVASAGIEAEVLAAAQGRIDGIPAKTQLKGALRLAPLLAPRPAADALVAVFASDPSQFAEVVWELKLVARRDPAAVSPEFVASLFRQADTYDNLRDRIYALAAALGRRGEPLVPILRERRTSDRPLDAVWSAIVLFHATGNPEEAMTAIRPLLERPDRGSVFVPWDAVGDVLTTVPLSKADRALVLGALPRATFAAPRTTIVRALGALGAEAAPLVPSLRAILSQEFGGAGDRDDEVALGIATCRVLDGLGPAARDALPDLRRWIALTIDSDGTTAAGAAAIRAIETSGR
ncbi:MAG: hypothetical protein K8T90_05820 [Planctomycetes bacterium]|nr:hypothetical protein [Planctomycetota bacterium]